MVTLFKFLTSNPTSRGLKTWLQHCAMGCSQESTWVTMDGTRSLPKVGGFMSSVYSNTILHCVALYERLYCTVLSCILLYYTMLDTRVQLLKLQSGAPQRRCSEDDISCRLDFLQDMLPSCVKTWTYTYGGTTMFYLCTLVGSLIYALIHKSAALSANTPHVTLR